MRAHLAAIEVIGTQIPLAVPAMGLDSFDHRIDMTLGSLSLSLHAKMSAQSGIVAAIDYKLAGYHERLGLRALRVVLGRLK